MTEQSEAQRRTARIAGVWFVITFIAAIAGLLLYDPVLNEADYIVGGGADTRVRLGAFCEAILAIANIATALVLFPILKRQSESIALAMSPLVSLSPRSSSSGSSACFRS